MLCPEGTQFQNQSVIKDEDSCEIKNNLPAEGSGSAALNAYKTPKTWKKSLTNFFRNSLRSTRSNDGDRPSGSKEKFEEKEISPEQKWQSLGKVFRRQSFANHWQKYPPEGESSQNKRNSVRKVISSYFGKSEKSLADANKN